MRIGVATAAIAGLLAAGCARDRSQAGLDVVRIADRGFLANAPIYIAEEEGFFADEGIRLQFGIKATLSTQLIPFMERGDIDVLAAAPTSGLFAALAQGAQLRIVADRGHVPASGCDYNGIVARGDLFTRDSATAEQIRGKRFAISPAGTTGYMADKYLASLGLTTSDLRTVTFGEAVEAQALEAGSIDGLNAAEPYLSRLLEEGHRLIAPATRYAPRMHFALVVFGPTLTVKNRALGQRFMTAYLRGVRQYREGATPRNVEIIARRSGFEPDVLRKVCLPAINADGEVDLAWLLDFQEWAVRKGYLSRVLGLGDGTDMSFARSAAKELGIATSVR